ncbi:MAG: hypothetical protein Kow0099_32280 [Candidatus Abyssubacteria bacterium]
MESETVLISILAAQTMFIAVGIVFFIWSGWHARKRAGELSELINSASPRVNDILDELREFLDSAKPAGEQLVLITSEIRSIVNSTRETVELVTDLVNEADLTFRKQLERADELVAKDLKRLEELSDLVASEIAEPVSEVAALIKGGRVAAKYIFRQHAPQDTNGHNEDAITPERDIRR